MKRIDKELWMVAFENSNATALPNLKEVGRKFTIDGSNLSDIRNLKEINGYKIEWD